MDKDNKRPEAYPKPSTADQQFENQSEFIDQQPNSFQDKSISDVSAPAQTDQTNDPDKDVKQ